MAFVNLLQVLYPVGAVYISQASTSPSSLIGGTWTQIQYGLLAAAGSPGFASNGGHGGSLYITSNNMPSHKHDAVSDSATASTNDYRFTLNRTWGLDCVARMNFGISSSSNYRAMGTNLSASDSVGIDDIGQSQYTGSVGGGTAYTQPHFSVNVWVRTA